MIDSLTIENFRSHKDTFIEFHPGLNAIIGDNDSGKTNLLRAIDLVANNRPTGAEYISHWGGTTRVGINVDKKFIQRHRRGNTHNLYTMTHADGEEDVFKAFGAGVPEPIAQHLNMSPVNIHFQLEGPFLLSLSPVDVARHFNNAVNLDNIDSTISNIGKILRKETTEHAIEIKSVEDLESQLKGYDWLDKAEGCLAKLEWIQQKIFKLYKSISELKTLMADHDGKLKKLSRLEKITEHEGTVERLLDIDDDIQISKENVSELSDLLKTLNHLKEQQNKVKVIVKFDRDVDRLLDLDNQIQKHTENYIQLEGLTDKLISLNEKHEGFEDTILDLTAEWERLMPDECPLCERSCDCGKFQKKKNES